MHHTPAICALAGLVACAPTPQVDDAMAVQNWSPEYGAIRTRLLAGGLVSMNVRMKNARVDGDVIAYNDCAAAQYALIRGYGFARHVRTNVVEEAGLWRADAVYTISPALPRGQSTIDAEVTVANCAETGIPTV